MLIIYPEELPGPELEGYALQTVNPLMRTDMDSGRARQRRRFTSVPVMVTAAWVLTEPQMQVFAGFYRWTLKDGAEWFEAPLKTEMGYKEYLCRFTGIYDGPTPFAWNDFRVSAQLEIRDRPTWDADWIEFGQDYILNADLIDLALNQEWPEA